MQQTTKQKTRGWTKEYAQQYQLNGLLDKVKKHHHVLLAEFVVTFTSIKRTIHKYLTGCILPYGYYLNLK